MRCSSFFTIGQGDTDPPHTPRRSSRAVRAVIADALPLGHASSPMSDKAASSSGGHSRPRGGRVLKSSTPRLSGPVTAFAQASSPSPAAAAFDQTDPEDLRRMELLSRLNQIELQRRELTRSSSLSLGALSAPGQGPTGIAAAFEDGPGAPTTSPSKRQRAVLPADSMGAKRRKSDPANHSKSNPEDIPDAAARWTPSSLGATVTSLPAVSRATRQSVPPRHSPAISARAQTSSKPPSTPILDIAAAGTSAAPEAKPRVSARAVSAPLSSTSGEPKVSLGPFAAPRSPRSPPGSPGGRSGRVRTPSVLLAKQPGEATATLYGAPGKSGLKNNQVSYCLRIVKDMLRLKDAFAFAKPIDKLWPRDQLPGYFEMISHPMDLTTIQANLESGRYMKGSEENAAASALQVFEPTQYARDMRLVFENARTYNRPGDIFYEAATRLSEKFEAKFAKLPSFKDPASASSKKKKKKDGTAVAGGASTSSRKESKRRKSSARTSATEGGVGNGGGVSAGRDRMSPRSKPKSRRQSGGPNGVSGGSGAGGTRNGDSEISASSKDPSKMTKREMGERLDALKRQLAFLDARSPSPSPTSGGASYLKQAQALYHVPMSFEEKVKLSENVGQLPGDKLQKLVALISKNTSSTMEVNNEEEIELDIDHMDNKTLRDMEAFVHQTLYKRRPGGRNGSSQQHGELAHLTRDQLNDHIDKITAVLESADRGQGGDGQGEKDRDGHGLKKQKSFYDDSESSSDSDSSGSSSDSASSDSSDSSDDDSSDDDLGGDEKRKRRERNLEHMRKMAHASSQPGTGTPLPSPSYGGRPSSAPSGLNSASPSPQGGSFSAPVKDRQSPASPGP